MAEYVDRIAQRDAHYDGPRTYGDRRNRMARQRHDRQREQRAERHGNQGQQDRELVAEREGDERHDDQDGDVERQHHVALDLAGVVGRHGGSAVIVRRDSCGGVFGVQPLQRRLDPLDQPVADARVAALVVRRQEDQQRGHVLREEVVVAERVAASDVQLLQLAQRAERQPQRIVVDIFVDKSPDGRQQAAVVALHRLRDAPRGDERVHAGVIRFRKQQRQVALQERPHAVRQFAAEGRFDFGITPEKRVGVEPRRQRIGAGHHLVGLVGRILAGIYHHGDLVLDLQVRERRGRLPLPVGEESGDVLAEPQPQCG